MDFGSTFGSGSVEMQLPNLSYEFWLDPTAVKRNILGFGLRTPKYRRIDWPDFPEYSSIGRWEADYYEPQEWRNDYPNPAFVRMTDRDAFWAAKIIMAFTPDELRAIVRTGEYSYEPAARYFAEVLIERQRKTAAYYFDRLNPIDEFVVAPEELRWRNLPESYGFAGGGTRYRVQWSVYDDGTGTTRSLDVAAEVAEPTAPLPAAPDVTPGTHRYLLAEIHALNDEHPLWNRRVGVYLRPTADGFDVVGIERESDPPDRAM